MKKNYLLRIFTFIFCFGVGFLAHAFFFPDFLPQEMTQASKKVIGIKPDKNEVIDQFVRKVSYSNGKFSPHTVVIRFGNYLSIVNESKDELMWLESDDKYLSTPRGYGEGEEQKVRMDTEGAFIVINKLNKEAKLKIVVKK